MKKLLLVFVGLLCSLVISAQTNFQELSLEKAREQARAENKPIFLDCYTSWCGPCKMMAPQFEQAASLLEPKVRLAKVNTEAEPHLAAQFGIRSIPTLILFRGGHEVARQAGAMGAQDIMRWVTSRLPQ